VLPQGGDAGPNQVRLDPSVRYQSIDGFGGCFNELGWTALQALDPGQRSVALKSLFDASGCNFSICRMGIGANDFALEWYSFDETPGDYAMADFSIGRDRGILIPYMKAAMQFQPGLAIWGVPWCPPSWMKTNGAYRGGTMRQDPRTLGAYALYFSKYVQAYRQEGINLVAVAPQNEPKYNDNVYPQCVWTGGELNTFLRDYLLPRLKKDNVDVQVWLGTIVNRNLADYVDPVLGDAVTGPGIAGVGYQYDGQNAMLETHEKYPDKKLMQTETECYNGEDSWEEGMNTFGRMIGDMNHFAGSYMFWNMILGEKSTSSWGWRQNSLLTLDSRTDRIVYNPEFYSLKHLGHFVTPGAVRIGLAVPAGIREDNPSQPGENAAAFRNPSGELVLVLRNPGNSALPIALHAGAWSAKVDLPARSMNSFVLSGW
jgi:glucosylceramidase